MPSQASISCAILNTMSVVILYMVAILPNDGVGGVPDLLIDHGPIEYTVLGGFTNAREKLL